MIIGLDLAPNATGAVIIGGDGKFLYWETITSPSILNPYRRIQYTQGRIRTLVEVFKIKEAAIEDYAHAQHGRGDATVREQGGIIKNMLIEMRIKVFLYNISTIKKFAVGDGKADKDEMKEAFIKLTKKRKDITEHVIDAYFIAQIHYTNHRLKLLGEDLYPYREIL